MIWEIELERDRGLEDEYSQMSALKHPTAEETDDYMEYKRVRREMLHKVREGILTGIPAKIPETPPAVHLVSEKPGITIQSPPMSPKTEIPSFVGDYCLMRDPVLPGSPESPPLSRTSFFQPAPSTRAKTGPAVKQEREKQPQARSLTVPQNLRKSRSNVSTDSRAKKSQGEATSKKASQHLLDNGVRTSVKDFARPQFGGRDAKGGIAKSFTRIFSDGAQDSDIPESPFGSVLADYDNGEPSSFPFDKQPTVSSPPPIAPLPPSSTTQSNDIQPAEKSSGSSNSNSSNNNPILRQVHWGTPAEDPSAKDLRQLSTDRLKREKSRHHQRRDRAVYEAFDRQAESADPRLLLAALNEVWDDCAEPEYADMVLEEPMAYESSSGYLGGYGGEGPAGRGGSQSQSGGGGGGGNSGSGNSSGGGGGAARAQRSRSDDYMLRIPPGGIDVARFIAQQATGEEIDDGGGSSGGVRASTGARKSWPLGDDAGTSSPSSVHEIRSVLREMSESSATSTEDVARRESQRLSSSSASTSSSSGGSVSGPSRRRRSSLGAFDSRMPTWTPDEGGSAMSRGARRPTIVRFSGMFKRQSLEETVDEVVDEGAAGEEEDNGKGGVLKEDQEEVKATEEIGGGFGDEPL